MLDQFIAISTTFVLGMGVGVWCCYLISRRTERLFWRLFYRGGNSDG